jgi:DNA-binding PadR family transcriptional regulator
LHLDALLPSVALERMTIERFMLARVVAAAVVPRSAAVSPGISSDTRGTASQAIKALEAGGYLVRQRSEADGRSASLRLTNKGKKALARDPFEVLVRAVDSLDAKEQTAMHHALHQVLTTVAASGRRFGVCQDTSVERCAAA